MNRMASPREAEIRSLVDVALGSQAADLAIVGGKVANVYTGEFLDGWSVATKGKRIAYVGDDASHTIGTGTKVIDASGKTLIPGLIDGHAHLLWHYNLDEFLRYAIRGGTTTIITETIEIASQLGYQGIVEFLESAKKQPIKMFATASPMPTVSPGVEAHAMDVETLRRLLERDEVVGLGEGYWSTLFNDGDRLFQLFAETLDAGKTLEGHSAGARGKKLVAYVASGISSCHESTTVEEAIDRLRLGLYTMIREGEVRTELPAVSGIRDKGIDPRRLLLTTDGVGPKRLVRDGYMEYVVQRAIDLGFEPIVAIQMATLNVAEYFSLDNTTGGIAPGKCADILIIPDPSTIRAEYVISNGRILAREGQLLVEPHKPEYTRKVFPGLEIRRNLQAADFAIPVGGTRDSARVRVINQVTDLVAREMQLDMPVSDGEIRADVDRDIVKIAVVGARGRGEKIFVGLTKGFGIRSGALATSVAWDTGDLVVVGATDHDMAEAANRCVALQGGIVVYSDGQVRAELALPIGGIISDEPMQVLAQKLDDIQREMARLGCCLPDVHLSISVSTSAAIPFLRISEEGLVDTKKGKLVSLIID